MDHVPPEPRERPSFERKRRLKWSLSGSTSPNGFRRSELLCMNEVDDLLDLSRR
jgi:hypothetical protein